MESRLATANSAVWVATETSSKRSSFVFGLWLPTEADRGSGDWHTGSLAGLEEQGRSFKKALKTEAGAFM